MVITYNFNKILEKYLQTSSTYFLVIFWLFRDIRIITSAAASKRKSYLRLRATQKALQYTVLQSHFRSANYLVFIRRCNNFFILNNKPMFRLKFQKSLFSFQFYVL